MVSGPASVRMRSCVCVSYALQLQKYLFIFISTALGSCCAKFWFLYSIVLWCKTYWPDCSQIWYFLVLGQFEILQNFFERAAHIIGYLSYKILNSRSIYQIKVKFSIY